MLWTLYKKSAQAALRSALAALLGSAPERDQQRMLVERISRIIQCLKQAANQHPAWLAQQYGSVDAYLEQHLSTIDWQYLLHLRQPATMTELPLPTC